MSINLMIAPSNKIPQWEPKTIQSDGYGREYFPIFYSNNFRVFTIALAYVAIGLIQVCTHINAASQYRIQFYSKLANSPFIRFDQTILLPNNHAHVSPFSCFHFARYASPLTEPLGSPLNCPLRFLIFIDTNGVSCHRISA